MAMVVSEPLLLDTLTRRIEETSARAQKLRELEMTDTLIESLSQFDETKNRTAPIASLPNEILSAIFEEGRLLPSSPHEEPPFEILVSQVTRWWRDVAIGTPALWTNLFISENNILLSASTYLARSGTLPIDLQADMADSTLSTGVIQFIAQNIGRFRRLCLEIDDSLHMPELILALRHSTAGLLENFQISLQNNTSCEGSDGRILLGGAPSLRTFRLRRIGVQCFAPPTAALTTLHIHSPPREHDKIRPAHATFSDILSSLPVLVHLVLHGNAVNNHSNIEFAELPALRSLHLFATESDLPALQLLLIISAPLLECLVLEDLSSEQLAVLPHDPYCTTSPRFPSLRSLTVSPYGMGFNSSAWLDLFRFFSTITEFKQLSNDCSELLVALRFRTPPDIPLPLSTIAEKLPHLRILSLSEIDDIHFPLLSNLLYERMAFNNPLEKLQLSKACLSSFRLNVALYALSQLREQVVVEEFQPERWPPDASIYEEWYEEV
jgi:hypothetical protein